MRPCPYKAAAIKAAATTYETGRPCKRGHVSPRYVSDGGCCVCNANKSRIQSKDRVEYRKRYYSENKARYKKLMAKWYLKNKDRVAKATLAWATKNPERVKAKGAAFRKKHPGRINAKTGARRALRLKATPSWIRRSPEMRSAILSIYQEAARLTKETGVQHHVDHIHPLKHKAICGLHVPWNLQIISASDNCKKGNLLKVEQLP